MNAHLYPRVIWLTRHGESIDNIHGRIGGDSSLSMSFISTILIYEKVKKENVMHKY